MKTKRESNSFEGMRVIADYNVGDQRIIVLERTDRAEGAVAGQKADIVAEAIPPIAARSATSLAVGGRGPWLRRAGTI